MTDYVALLRGINVGGHQKVSMSDLRGVIADGGFEDVRTLLQSGNVVFRGRGARGADLEALLEAEVERRLGLRTAFIVRSAREWQAVFEANPFPEYARLDPGRVAVTFLKDAPRSGGAEALRAALTGREVMQIGGRELYVVYPDGMGRSRLTLDVIERHLGTRGTARNWNTVTKLYHFTVE